MKRQIHIIYDFICDTNLIDDIILDKINLVLKENIFSLKNLYDIYNGILTPYLEKTYKLLIRHIDGCKVTKDLYGKITII